MNSNLDKILKFKYFYEFVIFIALCLISLFNFVLYVDDYYFHFFLLDFSHGYMTRGFMGEIVSWFTDTVTRTTAVIFVSVALFFLNLVMSLLFGKLIKSCDSDFRKAVILIILSIIISPMNFIWLARNGMQADLYFYLFTFASVLVLDNKILQWFIPAFGILATLFSVVYSVHCMTLIAIILLYRYSKEKKISNLLLCILTYAGIIGVALYAVSTRDNITYENSNELYEHMIAKVPLNEGSLMEDTIKYYIGEYFLPFDKAVKAYIPTILRENFLTIILSSVFIYFPFVIISSTFWIKCIKHSSDFLSKLIYIFAILAMLLTYAPAVFTGEPGRWNAPAYTVELGLLLYFIYDKNEVVCSLFGKLIEKIKGKPFILIAPLAYLILMQLG